MRTQSLLSANSSPTLFKTVQLRREAFCQFLHSDTLKICQVELGLEISITVMMTRKELLPLEVNTYLWSIYIFSIISKIVVIILFYQTDIDAMFATIIRFYDDHLLNSEGLFPILLTDPTRNSAKLRTGSYFEKQTKFHIAFLLAHSYCLFDNALESEATSLFVRLSLYVYGRNQGNTFTTTMSLSRIKYSSSCI